MNQRGDAMRGRRPQHPRPAPAPAARRYGGRPPRPDATAQRARAALPLGARPEPRPGRPRPGAVGVFRLPRTEPVAESVPPKPLMVKRVAARGGDPVPEAVRYAVGARPGDRVPAGSLVLLGDNGHVASAGGDSRDW